MSQCHKIEIVANHIIAMTRFAAAVPGIRRLDFMK
jgi:hypothetical protein